MHQSIFRLRTWKQDCSICDIPMVLLPGLSAVKIFDCLYIVCISDQQMGSGKAQEQDHDVPTIIPWAKGKSSRLVNYL